MTKKITVNSLEAEDGSQMCQELERGNILFFPEIPFPFPKEEIAILLSQKQGSSKGRKNIAYKPQIDRVTNLDVSNPEVAKQVKDILRQFSARVASFLGKALPAYAQQWSLDYASFRPFQEKGRSLRLRARNDLLHVDAFPTRPLCGARILRFFINIHPNENRCWVTSDGFAALVEKYGDKGVAFPQLGWIGKQCRAILKSIGVSGLSRSPYDSFMLSLHNFLKENEDFQKKSMKDYWEFPPYSCWAVFTDQVSHAALSGQYALEQTFLVPVQGLISPEQSPLHILERLSGVRMLHC